MRADNSVNHIRMIAHDPGQGFNRAIQSLSGAEQSECHQHHSPFKAKALLERCLPAKRPVGCAVLDHVDDRRGRSIDARKKVAGMFGHHYDGGSARDQVQHDPALLIGRLRQNRVECEYERRCNLLGKIADHLAALAAEDAKLVLDPDGVYSALVDLRRCGTLRCRIVRAYNAACLGVLYRLRRIVDYVHIQSQPGAKRLQGLRNVSGESGKPAPARRVAAYQSQPERLRLDSRRGEDRRGRKCRHMFDAYEVRQRGKGNCWHGAHFSAGEHRERVVGVNVPKAAAV